jgi:hypothetical protein
MAVFEWWHKFNKKMPGNAKIADAQQAARHCDLTAAFGTSHRSAATGGALRRAMLARDSARRAGIL